MHLIRNVSSHLHGLPSIFCFAENCNYESQGHGLYHTRDLSNGCYPPPSPGLHCGQSIQRLSLLADDAVLLLFRGHSSNLPRSGSLCIPSLPDPKEPFAFAACKRLSPCGYQTCRPHLGNRASDFLSFPLFSRFDNPSYDYFTPSPFSHHFFHPQPLHFPHSVTPPFFRHLFSCCFHYVLAR